MTNGTGSGSAGSGFFPVPPRLFISLQECPFAIGWPSRSGSKRCYHFRDLTGETPAGPTWGRSVGPRLLHPEAPERTEKPHKTRDQEETTIEKIRIGISACLLGQNVRYDGGHQHDRYITDTIGRWFEWVPVCPEVEYGLPVPREAMRLVGDTENPRLVTIRTRIDHTDGMLAWVEKRLEALAAEDLCGFIFKSRSPSSGMAAVKVYGDAGMAVEKGVGIFAGAFMKRFPLLPVEEDGRLNDPLLRENFIERIFVYRRWRELEKRDRDRLAVRPLKQFSPFSRSGKGRNHAKA